MPFPRSRAMASGDIKPKQLVLFLLKHGAWVVTTIGILYGGFVAVNHISEQWNQHMDAGSRRLARLESKVDKLQEGQDKILFLLVKRR